MAAVNDDKKTNDTENKSKDIENELKDDENQMNSPYHNAFCKFEDFCKIAHKTLTSETINISKSNEWKDPDDITYNEVTECGFLSKWIYDKTKYRFLLKDIGDEMIYKESEKCQTATWSIILNKKTKSLYIAFKGTGSPKGDTLGIDILQDISIIPSPIWVADDKINPDDIKKKDEDDDKSNDWIDLRKNHHHRFDFAVHSGMYAAVQRNFGTILQDGLRPHNTSFNKLYITGHSLGGGLGILFGLELLLRNLIPDRVIAKVIVFGAPNVVSLEYEVPTHRIDAAQVLSQLHSMTHCFINKFDIVPRIPSAWIFEILLPAIPDMLQSGGFTLNAVHKVKQHVVDIGAKSFVETIKKMFIKHKDILNTFRPFGLYHILLGDKEKNAFHPNDSVNKSITLKLLSFIPPVERKVNGENGIVIHYFYTKDNDDKIILDTIKQESMEFKDNTKQFKESDDEYKKLKPLLFKQNDWKKLISDHFMDNYLKDIVMDSDESLSALKMKYLTFLKGFSKAPEVKDLLWNNKDVFKSNIYGEFKLEEYKMGSGMAVTAIRSLNILSNHPNHYRIILKSNIFTHGKWK
eukprot:317076_1